MHHEKSFEGLRSVISSARRFTSQRYQPRAYRAAVLAACSDAPQPFPGLVAVRRDVARRLFDDGTPVLFNTVGRGVGASKPCTHADGAFDTLAQQHSRGRVRYLVRLADLNEGF